MIFATLLALAAVQDAPPPDTDASVAAPETAADGSQRWSVLADPCASARQGTKEIVVCGQVAEQPRLPIPGERGPPDRPVPSNPDISGSGALAATGAPCATLSQGCTTGVDLFGGGTALVRLVGKLIDPGSCCEDPGEATNVIGLVRDGARAVGRVGKKKPDKSKRIPILLDDLPPEPAARDEAEEQAPPAPTGP